MIELPYGVADFRLIRREGLVYVDRTAYIHTLERLGRNLVFLRPRRFGKSLWIQTLASYYDVGLADDFEQLFGDLAIGAEPTPERSRYLVLQWNFSNIKPGSVEEIERDLREHVAVRAADFSSQYAAILPRPVEVEGNASAILHRLLSVVRQTPYRVYLFIDEYDNFVNEVMAHDLATYRQLFIEAGPFKLLFKSVKNALEGQGVERVFTTGISPVALNDLTSGFNNAKNVSLKSSLSSLCGFDSDEVRELTRLIAAERELSLGVDEAVELMRTWYNGYCFSESSKDLVYNPTNVLYFLQELYEEGRPPQRLHDVNLRTDRGKLAFLARSAAGAGVIERLTEGNGEIDIFRLADNFSVDDLLEKLETDRDTVASFLYYMGMLSLGEAPDRLRIPNLVVRKLFLDRLLEIYLPQPTEATEARHLALALFKGGDLQPLLTFFEEKLLPVLSNRDRVHMNEMVLKALFLSLLFDDTRYVIFSELEVTQSYADLCLLVRKELSDASNLVSLLFELKHVRRKELGRSGTDLRAMDDDALRALPPVRKAFTEARAQAQRYRSRLIEIGEGERLRSHAVVLVGLEHVLSEEVQ